ncbi:MAG: hypothetical protein A2W98_13320 [Bacteroidetes bacterium GWF2_33_38]|nr:MAG: hypothetical protein A2W98_13320 [Bacteroidetes bacterium GWF2_33_38]OFY70067.1 MAG: hypothetical protein A2265_07115 [Bacteroidetes bacterium RIFOXYA12_FULL_33_9]OFY91821.1 MAG: hypothetical protein A2236_02950 [Bacteroidetes bacterium RIFOXYA2_FULL_33_7]
MDTKTKITIFIIEDNDVFALALKSEIETVFANMQLSVHSFTTGELSMEKFNEEKPQIVILDYHLNSKDWNALDGIKVLDWIINKNKETLVVMLTRDDHVDIAIKSFHHGASDYVVKNHTQFKKINFSLLNFFKIIQAKNNSEKYLSKLKEYRENSKN